MRHRPVRPRGGRACARDGAVRCVSRAGGRRGGHRRSTTSLAGRVAGWASVPARRALGDGRARASPCPGSTSSSTRRSRSGAGLGSSAAVEVALALAVAELTGATSRSDEWRGSARPARRRWPARRPGSWTSSPSSTAAPATRCSSTAATSRASCVPLRAGHVGVDAARHRHHRRPTPPAPPATARAARSARRRRDASASARCATPRSTSVTDRLDGVLQRRARHVVTENERVARAAALLREGRMRRGRPAPRRRPRVAARRLRGVVRRARPRGRGGRAAGAWGARMTGAGFGGCAIALVAARRGARTSARRSTPRSRASGYAPPAVFAVTSADGARRCG